MAKGTFGERLKRERELREVTLEEVASATRISERFLQALENEDWNRLPGGVFGRGFVRTIARYLGLDEENLLAEYDLARGEAASPAPLRPEERIPSPPKWIPVALVLGLLLLLGALAYGGVYAWRLYAAHRAARHASALVPPQPSAHPSSPASSAPPIPAGSAAALDLSVAASASTHVRILGDGKLLFDGDLPGGDTRHFQALDRFEVSASDSSSVLLELNGQALPPLGAPGSSGTMVFSRKDLEPATGGDSQP
jgi:cytoskeleton protein RodZ